MDTPFSTFEKNIRDQLNRMLGSAGFDAAPRHSGHHRESLGPRLRLYSQSTLRSRLEENEKPWVIGRQRVGQIAIANSDAGASAYTDVAIDQAYRAIADLFSS